MSIISLQNKRELISTSYGMVCGTLKKKSWKNEVPEMVVTKQFDHVDSIQSP